MSFTSLASSTRFGSCTDRSHVEKCLDHLGHGLHRAVACLHQSVFQFRHRRTSHPLLVPRKSMFTSSLDHPSHVSLISRALNWIDRTRKRRQCSSTFSIPFRSMARTTYFGTISKYVKNCAIPYTFTAFESNHRRCQSSIVRTDTDEKLPNARIFLLAVRLSDRWVFAFCSLSSERCLTSIALPMITVVFKPLPSLIFLLSSLSLEVNPMQTSSERADGVTIVLGWSIRSRI